MLLKILKRRYSLINKKLFTYMLVVMTCLLLIIYSGNISPTLSMVIGALLNFTIVIIALLFGSIGAIIASFLNSVGFLRLFQAYLKTSEIHYFTSACFIFSTILSVILIGYIVEKNQLLRDSLTENAITDELTQLKNFKNFHITICNYIEKCKEIDETLGLIILDVDNFKTINDTYGHQIGDEVLKNIGSIINGNTRNQDTAFRLGGDEFAIIIPGSSKKTAKSIFDRIQSNCNKLSIPVTGSMTISLSAGYASYPCDCDNAHDLFKIADDAMYKIKFSQKGDLQFA